MCIVWLGKCISESALLNGSTFALALRALRQSLQEYKSVYFMFDLFSFWGMS